MDDFIDARLLDCVSHGSSFGLEFSTNIITLKSGIESRAAIWAYPRGKFSIDYNALLPEQIQAVKSAFMVCRGSLIGFRFKDWTDYEVKEQFLAYGTGEKQELQLFKSYNFANSVFQRKITKPILTTIKLWENGKALEFEADNLGKLTFTAQKGANISGSFEFDIPVRFDSDSLVLTPLLRREDGFLVQTGADLQEIIL